MSDVLETPLPPIATRAERIALRLLQLGAIGGILAVSTYHVFELDRFFVPKELVLHSTALIAALFTLRALWRMGMTRIDLLLAGYLLLSALSALMATNRWLTLRALAISASSVVLFWVARILRKAGLRRALLGGLALAVVVTAATSLLQAYGVDIDLFSENRSPGGTLGNRNFIAHVAAFGFPLLLLAALQAEKRSRYLRWAIGTAFVVAALVLTRSRAAWLAFAGVLLVLLVASILSAPLRRDRRMWKRIAGIIFLCAGASALAIVLPNALHWHGRNPYLESVRRVTEYSEGSGHGRIVQYEQSLLLALHHPLFGVGPGNWPVEYPKRVGRNDLSLDQTNEGMTANPWPSSDWVACIAERGPAALVLLVLVFAGLAMNALRRLRRATDPDDALAAVTLLGVLAGATLTGMFDAVLLLAVPALLVWTAFGALTTNEERASGTTWRLVVLAIAAMSVDGVIRSGGKLMAMDVFATHSDRASLVRAAQIDPGNYRLQLRLARLRGRDRCVHARAAHALFPAARAAADASRGCGK